MSDSIWPESCGGCEWYALHRESSTRDATHKCNHDAWLRMGGTIITIDRSATPPHRPPWCPKEATE
jgi:hypothetical protein